LQVVLAGPHPDLDQPGPQAADNPCRRVTGRLLRDPGQRPPGRRVELAEGMVQPPPVLARPAIPLIGDVRRCRHGCGRCVLPLPHDRGVSLRLLLTHPRQPHFGQLILRPYELIRSWRCLGSRRLQLQPELEHLGLGALTHVIPSGGLSAGWAGLCARSSDRRSGPCVPAHHVTPSQPRRSPHSGGHCRQVLLGTRYGRPAGCVIAHVARRAPFAFPGGGSSRDAKPQARHRGEMHDEPAVAGSHRCDCAAPTRPR
jgi:hypothetical protein